MVPLGVSNEVCGFPPAKMAQLDQDMNSGFNVITFDISTSDHSILYEYQSKMPVFCAFTENSAWHDVNRALTD